MKCPNCGAELSKGNLYCEVCGMEIQIVPDFEPEIENSITETLSTVAKDVIPQEMPDDKRIELQERKKKKRILVLVGLGCAGLLLILFGALLGARLYRDNFVDIQVKKAVSEYEKEHFVEAAKFYENAMAMDDKDIMLRINYADCLAQMGETQKAIEEYLSIIALDEHNEIAYAKLISLYESSGDYHTINTLLSNCTDEKIQNEFQSYMAKTPEFNYKGGAYEQVVPLKLIAPSSGKIYYTMDGTTPGKGSLIYTAPIFLRKGTYEIKAVYINDFGIASDVVTQIYTIEAVIPAAPLVEPQSGEYNIPQLITVEVPAGCNVYYTTDGSAPGENSSIYGEAIPMKTGISNYKFVAISKEGVPSDVVERTYQLTVETNLSATDAVRRLKYRLVELDRLLDAEGNLENMSGKNIYVYNSLHYVDNKTLYFIYEYYQEGDNSRNMTGTIYAVDAQDGWVYKVIKDTSGNVSLEPV
ncbi:MAG: FN3 associated domain-containing protein [Lachnospiraceae bacterium]|nr:FN3 associated domain-containing protein [Lachnospiraceae bacterium]